MENKLFPYCISSTGANSGSEELLNVTTPPEASGIEMINWVAELFVIWIFIKNSVVIKSTMNPKLLRKSFFITDQSTFFC